MTRVANYFIGGVAGLIASVMDRCNPPKSEDKPALGGEIMKDLQLALDSQYRGFISRCIVERESVVIVMTPENQNDANRSLLAQEFRDRFGIGNIGRCSFDIRAYGLIVNMQELVDAISSIKNSANAAPTYLVTDADSGKVEEKDRRR